MSDDMSKMISNMLSNPDALKKLASDFAGEMNSGAPAEPDGIDVRNMISAINNTDDRRITLLTALKPYLSSTRAVEADKAIKLLRLTKISQFLRNEVDL